MGTMSNQLRLPQRDEGADRAGGDAAGLTEEEALDIWLNCTDLPSAKKPAALPQHRSSAGPSHGAPERHRRLAELQRRRWDELRRPAPQDRRRDEGHGANLPNASPRGTFGRLPFDDDIKMGAGSHPSQGRKDPPAYGHLLEDNCKMGPVSSKDSTCASWDDYQAPDVWFAQRVTPDHGLMDEPSPRPAPRALPLAPLSWIPPHSLGRAPYASRLRGPRVSPLDPPVPPAAAVRSPPVDATDPVVAAQARELERLAILHRLKKDRLEWRHRTVPDDERKTPCGLRDMEVASKRGGPPSVVNAEMNGMDEMSHASSLSGSDEWCVTALAGPGQVVRVTEPAGPKSQGRW